MAPKSNDIPEERATILVVDDDPVILTRLQEILRDAGHHTEKAVDGKEALDVLARCDIDLMLLDLELPRVSGMEVLRQSVASHPQMPVIIFSATGTIQTAVEATRLGIYDFLEKPADRERILLTVRNALEKVRLQRQRDHLLEEARWRYRMVGSGPAMQRIYRFIDKAAAVQSRVLIVGESGTGKELIARAIHQNSSRVAGPFVAVNCAAIPEELIESELFGIEGRVATGVAARAGKFEQADGGTLFLDEIGDMSLMTQAKILRALAENQIVRVGGSKPIPVDVRVITATNKDLEAEMKVGNFREDLFYRLCVINIDVPPLRERREDIPSLVDHFVLLEAETNELPPKQLERRALAMLVEYDWPGNIRQLQNVVERLVAFSDGETIAARDVAEALNRLKTEVPTHPPPSLGEARDRFERDFILKTLIAYDWKIQESATALGIDRSNLWRKIKHHSIEQRP